MKNLAIAAVALCLGASPASAADLSLKAPQSPLANILGAYTGSGLYIGFNAGGGGGSTNLGPANVVDLQGLMGVTIGYAWTMSPTRFAAIEADFDAMNLSTGTTAGITLNGPVDIDVRGLYGFPIQDFLGMVPLVGNLLGGNVTLPPFNALPAGVTAGNSHMYVFGGFDVKDVSANIGAGSNTAWLIAPQLGFGNRVQLSNGFAMDSSLAVQFDSRGMCIGVPAGGEACPNIGMNVIGKLKWLY